MNDTECIKMYKTFIEPYFLYAIEAWGHSLQSEKDILVKLQSKVLRILFNCYRTADAWKQADGQIRDIRELYQTVINKLCMKHHFGALPNNFAKEIMPEFNIDQLDNKITRISLNDMYDYKSNQNLDNTKFKNSCKENWNSLSFQLKVLPYSLSKIHMHRAIKTLSSLKQQIKNNSIQKT